MKKWELKAKELDCVNVAFKSKDLDEHEKEFELQNKQGLLFDEVEFSEFETCFCGK